MTEYITVRLTAEAHRALTRWKGRLQSIRGEPVHFPEAVETALTLANTHSDTEIKEATEK